MNKKFIGIILICVLLFMGSSPWEGAAVIAPEGELPASGLFVATNSFPVNTIVDITNIETNRSTRVIVAKGLDSPGLLAIISKEAADLIGIRAGSVGRVRMVQPQDPIAYLRFIEGQAQGIPPYDSGNIITSPFAEDTYVPLAEVTNEIIETNETQQTALSGLSGPSYILEQEWQSRNEQIVTVEGYNDPVYTPPIVPEGTLHTAEIAEIAEEPVIETVFVDEFIEQVEEPEYITEEPWYIVEEETEEIEGELLYLAEEYEELEEELWYLEEELEYIAEELEEMEEELWYLEEELEYIAEEPEEIEEELWYIEEELEYIAEEPEEIEEELWYLEEELEYIAEELEELEEELWYLEEELEYIAEELEEIEEELWYLEEELEYIAEELEELEEELRYIEEELEYIAEELEELEEEPIYIAEEIYEDKIEEEIEYVLTPAEERPPELIYGIDPKDIIPEITAPVTETIREPEPPAAVPEIIVQPVPVTDASFSVPRVSELQRGSYYVQLAAFNSPESVENTLARIDNSFKPVVFRDRDNLYRILLGPMNQGESAAVLARFKSIGYKDAFIRQGR